MSTTTGPISRTGRLSRLGRLGRGCALLGASVAVSAALAAVPMTDAAAATKAVSAPSTPSGLPSGLENLAPYVGQVSCDPTPKPGTLALARLLTSTYAGTGYTISEPCGSESIASEHTDGRALDWTVSASSPAQKAQAEALLNWLLATDSAGRPASIGRRLGVMYIIWNDRIWSSHDPMSGWQPYSSCQAHPEAAANEVCHRNKLHISLSWAGALKRTSFWTKTVAADDYGPCRPSDLNWAPAYTTRNAKPCPSYSLVAAPSKAGDLGVTLIRYSGATVGQGDTGPVVAAVQKALGITPDGAFGPYTADALSAYQAKYKLTVTGRTDAATWRQLLTTAGVRVVQPLPTPVTPSSSLSKYKKLVLKYGSRGEAVTALQKRLKITADGMFGPNTKAAVIAFQKSKKLAATGIVDAKTWTALGA